MRVAILTVSDAGARGERADTSGDAAAAWAAGQGATVVARAIVPDATVPIVQQLLAANPAEASRSLMGAEGHQDERADSIAARAEASAASSLSGSRPPAWAIVSRPPPPPPTTSAAVFTTVPALTPRATSSGATLATR